LVATPVEAGDRALIDYLGYSDDGRSFAFEEFGIQDGSGFPYANIYVIDLATDSWVAGTPIRVRIETESASVTEARETALSEATPILDQFGIGTPAQLLAVNGDGEVGTAGHGLSFGRPGYGLDGPQDPVRLTLETFSADSPQDCETYLGESALGFALSLDGTVIQEDGETLPNSRGCPMDYRIHAVVAPADWSGASGGRVAIIASYPFGFEGPDRRFLAVPIPD
jgi:predicted secreted protein